MARPPMPTLDPKPLLAEMRRQGVTSAVLAARVGKRERTVLRRLYEPLSWSLADEYAVALEMHPSLIWGKAWWEIAAHYDTVMGEARDARNARRRLRWAERRSVA